MALLTEEQQNVAVNALATTLGKPVSEIEGMLAGDKPTDVDKLVSERIKSVRKEGEDAGKGKLQKVANAKAKELFGTETADVETIVDLLTTVKDKYKAPTDPASLTEEQVKSHTAFRTLESTLASERTKHAEALEKAKNDALAEVNKERLNAKALQALTDFGAVLSDDPKLAAVQKRMYLEQLEGVSTKEVDGKLEFWKTDADGKSTRIETDKLLPKSESDYLKELVEAIYTTKVSEQTTSTGLQQQQAQQQQGEKKFKGQLPKTQQEYDAIVQDRDKYTIDQRQEVITYWNTKDQK
ncbi:hypothetical protein [Spirosoma litoris]